MMLMLALSGCGTTVSSADAICSIQFPTMTPEEFQALTDRTQGELDVYFEKVKRACSL